MLGIGWELLVGLGIFLYGMSRLETGIGTLGDARLKNLLSRSTGSAISSAGFGALVTAILQSSSMVSLLALAFASAGIVPLYNAIGILIGANLGTTVTGWIVATLGFKLDLAELALPLLGIGGFAQVLTRSDRRLYHWGETAIGLGLLLFGLTLMKDNVGDLPQRWGVAALQGYPPFVYLLAALVVTALIQSSSATVMLTLTALHGGMIGIAEAGALVIGADLGTTGTTLLASITGPAIKRQLALAQVAFNLAVDLFAFVVLLPLLPAAIDRLGINDPLYSVVAFHTGLNLLGLVVFLPILKPFSRWVERFFQTPKTSLELLAEIATPVPEAAFPAMLQALRRLWLMAAANTMRLLRVDVDRLPLSAEQSTALGNALESLGGEVSQREVYEAIKRQEAGIIRLAYKLQQAPLDEQQSRCLGTMQELARNIVYSAKTMQDIGREIGQLTDAASHGDGPASWQLSEQQTFLADAYARMLALVVERHEPAFLHEQLAALEGRNDEHHHSLDRGVYQRTAGHTDGKPSLSSRLNVNREINHATRDVLRAVGLLTELEASR